MKSRMNIIDDTRKIGMAEGEDSISEDCVAKDSAVSDSWFESSAFLLTPQNKHFLDSLPQHTRDKLKIIERDRLKEYYDTDIKIVGITGTNGKTTTAAAIYSILLDLGYKVALIGTRGMFANNKRLKEKGLTTPSLLELYKDIDMACRLDCDFFVMEVSSHAIKQERIFGLTFFAKILTNITSDHLDYHKTWQDYAESKLSFLKSGQCVKIINLDDKSGATLRFLDNVFSYGIESKGDLFVSAYSLREGIFAQVRLMDIIKGDKYDLAKCEIQDTKDSKQTITESKNTKNLIKHAIINSPLFGLFNLYNLLAATLVTKMITDESLERICDVLSNFAGVAGRMEIVSESPLIIIDFAHTTDGFLQVFESFKAKKIAVVFGAGGDRDSSKRAKMGQCATTFAHTIYITNDNPRSEDPQKIANQILDGVLENPNFSVKSNNIKIILDRKEAIKVAIEELKKQDSKNEWVLLILGKGDENTQIFKDETIHFSDRECVRDILNEVISQC